MFFNDPDNVDREAVEQEAKRVEKPPLISMLPCLSTSAFSQALIPEYLERLNSIDKAISKNYHVLKQILADGRIFAGEEKDEPNSNLNNNDDHNKGSRISQVTEFDMDKLRSTIKQFLREWSSEGKPERDATYKPLLEALIDHYKDVPIEKSINFKTTKLLIHRPSIKVLVPGAGLGRVERIHQYEIYPFIHSFSNIVSSDDQLRPVYIPDALPSTVPADSNFSMVAGDFVEVYGEDQHIGIN
ncbi:3339_t:CDS:2 [Acaulospora colombiana]|uniref:3339_t:CDS:1 n=1 Tax=Acaulospora colombiana TaxID=27376 RepID=A0ACA9LBN0_9GLOM|nr:3339_t:CDS:2 [Acaulospora colombiana]